MPSYGSLTIPKNKWKTSSLRLDLKRFGQAVLTDELGEGASADIESLRGPFFI